MTVLKGMCKKYKLKSTGKRDILIERLDQFSNGKQKKTKEKIKKSKNVSFQKKPVNFLNVKQTYNVKKMEIKNSYSELYQFMNNDDKQLNKCNLVLNSDFLVIGKLDKNKKKYN